MQLNEGEEIIGIYGRKDSNNRLLNLGFIVWTPHYDWLKFKQIIVQEASKKKQEKQEV